ncbi:MAG TPA: carboxypeptidase-like regulatory domain-containing protein, partial [Cytophagaceae bacterium]
MRSNNFFSVLWHLLLVLLLTSNCQYAFAQQRRIMGKVRNTDNVPLSKVSVLIRGTNIGTLTNEKGEYEITIPQEGVLIFSSIGYVSQEIATEGKQTIN